MLTNKQKKLLDSAWNKLEYAFSILDWTSYAKNLLKQTIEESKMHDRYRGDSIPRGLSVLSEARYFAIKRLQDYKHGESLDPTNFVHTQTSCFIAYSLANSNRFTSLWEKLDPKVLEAMREIASWDYCDLIKVD